MYFMRLDGSCKLLLPLDDVVRVLREELPAHIAVVRARMTTDFRSLETDP
jgi:hypothetical protein